MKDKDIHKLIEAHDRDSKADMYARLQSKYNFIDKPIKKAQETQTKKWDRKIVISCVAFAVAIIVCIISCIPFMLKTGTMLPSDSSVRYCSIDECYSMEVDFTVKDYAQTIGKPLLYLDWYNDSAPITTLYVDSSYHDDVIFIKEKVINKKLDYVVTLRITDIHTIVDGLAFHEQQCKKSTTIDKVKVKYFYGEQWAEAVFEYKDYKYYVELTSPPNEQAILDLVKEML